MASSGGSSQLPAPAPGDKVHQSFSFLFPQREFGSGEALVSKRSKYVVNEVLLVDQTTVSQNSC